MYLRKSLYLFFIVTSTGFWAEISPLFGQRAMNSTLVGVENDTFKNIELDYAFIAGVTKTSLPVQISAFTVLYKLDSDQ